MCVCQIVLCALVYYIRPVNINANKLVYKRDLLFFINRIKWNGDESCSRFFFSTLSSS